MRVDELSRELQELRSSEELAEALGLAVQTVYNLRSRGVFVPRRILGRRPLYDLKECVERYDRLCQVREGR